MFSRNYREGFNFIVLNRSQTLILKFQEWQPASKQNAAFINVNVTNTPLKTLHFTLFPDGIDTLIVMYYVPESKFIERLLR